MNTPKSFARKTKDKVFANIIELIVGIQVQIEDIKETQNLQSKMFDSLMFQIKKSSQNIIRLSDKEIIARLFSGAKIVLDPSDISVGAHIALDSIWEENITLAWLKTVTPDDTVLDIGANFGYYGILAAQQLKTSKQKVFFFEANPQLIPYIKRSLEVNYYSEISAVENVAVSDKNGKATLNILKDHTGSSSLQPLKSLRSYADKKFTFELDKTIAVNTITIDEYCKQNKIHAVDLIKMDIEGHEDSAYSGMREIIHSSPRATLFVEFTRLGYKNPRAFFKQMSQDFKSVFTIAVDGSIVKPVSSSYDDLIEAQNDWIMLVFTKNKELIDRVEGLR